MDFAQEKSALREWMKSLVSDDQLAREKAENGRLKAQLAARVLRTDGSDVWERFVKDLQLQSQSFDALGIRGMVTASGDVDTEAECRIDVALKDSLWPVSTSRTFSYRSGQSSIRGLGEDGSVWLLHFQIVDDELMVISDGGGKLLSPEKAAESVLSKMILSLKKKA